MLHRPPEKKWVFRQPAEPFMPCPSRGLFLGPSGSGKTTTLISLMLGPYKNIFDGIYIFSPSVSIDSAWDPVVDHIKHLKGHGMFAEWDERALWAILNQQRDLIKTLKLQKTTKPLPQVLVVIDDFADNPHVMHNSSNILTSLMVRGRHFGSSTWISSQKHTALSLVARVNLQFLCVWRLRNAKEIAAIMEELSALYDQKTLYAMYDLAVHDEDYSWWYVLLTAKRKEDMFWVRFSKKLVVQ